MTVPRDHDDAGASAVEYGLLVAAVAAVIVVILLALGGQVHGLFDKTCDAMGAKTTPAADCE